MTDTLEQLRIRERRAHELLSVVKTMKSFAAGSIRDYERAAEALGQYASVVDLGFRIMLRVRPEAFDAGQRSASPPLLLVLVGSDQGMVGRFNEEIVQHVHAYLQDKDGSSRQVIAVGTRLANCLALEGTLADTIIELPGSAESIVRRVQELLVRLEEWIRGQRDPHILLAHHRPSVGGSYEATKQMLLPLDDTWLQQLRASPWPHRGIPSYSMSEHRLAKALVRQYLLVSLQRALAQSLAAEQAKRLSAMQAAEKNVLESIANLQARHRRQRQAEITGELLEVTAGFDVLESESV